MDNPKRHLCKFIASYYYCEVTEETVKADADALINFMRERGWQFESTNANLIAAAPDMLAALKALVNLDQRCGWHSTALDQSLAAIAKAEGRAE